MPHMKRNRVFPEPPDIGNPPDSIIDWTRKVVDTWDLTPREREICDLMLKGLSTEEISATLESGQKTVKHHISAIFRKAHVASRSQLFAEILRL